MIAIIVAASALASTVAIAVAMAAQNNALEQRTTANIRTATDGVQTDVNSRIATIDNRATQATATATNLSKQVVDRDTALAKSTLQSDSRISQNSKDVSRLDAISIPGLKPHVEIGENSLKLASSPANRVDVTLGNGALRTTGTGTYIDAAGPSGYVNIGGSASSGVRIGDSGKGSVQIGSNGTVFNARDGSTTINPSKGSSLTLAEGPDKSADVYGFSAANSFQKVPGGSAFVKHVAGAQIEIGNDRVHFKSRQSTPIQLESDRVDVTAPGGICMDKQCLKADDIAALKRMILAQTAPPAVAAAAATAVAAKK